MHPERFQVTLRPLVASDVAVCGRIVHDAFRPSTEDARATPSSNTNARGAMRPGRFALYPGGDLLVLLPAARNPVCDAAVSGPPVG